MQPEAVDEQDGGTVSIMAASQSTGVSGASRASVPLVGRSRASVIRLPLGTGDVSHRPAIAVN